MSDHPYQVREFDPGVIKTAGDIPLMDVRVDGIWYSHVNVPGVNGPDDSPGDTAHAKAVPAFAVSKMATWVEQQHPGGENPDAGGGASQWVRGVHTDPVRFNVLTNYCNDVWGINRALAAGAGAGANTNPLAPHNVQKDAQQTAEAGVNAVKDSLTLLGFFTSQQFWLRIGEGVVGAILLGVAVRSVIK